MRTIRIYQPGSFKSGESLQLDKTASNHLIRVLRLKDKQQFILFNGDGFNYSTTLEVDGKKAIAHIQSAEIADNESSLSIHLLQGISKGERMDISIQKSVELGVKAITPLICERTVVNLKADRLDKKLSHWKGITVSACEQSGRAFIPEIHSPSKLSKQHQQTDALQLMLDPLSDIRLDSIKNETNNIQILIGPEGGLSEQETTQARDLGFIGVSLGPRILRTETAALAAITSVQLLWGDF